MLNSQNGKDNREIIIVGAGIAGIITAYNFQLNGFQCTLLESDEAAQGSIAYSTGILQYETDVPLTAEAKIPDLQKAFHDCEKAIDELEKLSQLPGDDCDFRRVPGLCLAYDQKDCDYLLNEMSALRNAGFKCEMLGESELFEKFGFSAMAAMLTGGSAQIHGRKLVLKLLKLFEDLGGRYYHSTHLVHYKISLNEVVATVESYGKRKILKADELIIATGYAEKFLPDLELERNITYTTDFHFDQDLKSEFNSWDCNDPYYYLRSQGKNSVKIGGLDEEYSTNDLQAKVELAAQKLRDYFSRISGISSFREEPVKACKFISTLDGLPIIGALEQGDKVHYALSFGGNGIIFSVIAASELLKSIRDNTYEIPSRYKPARLRMKTTEQ